MDGARRERERERESRKRRIELNEKREERRGEERTRDRQIIRFSIPLTLMAWSIFSGLGICIEDFNVSSVNQKEGRKELQGRH